MKSVNRNTIMTTLAALVIITSLHASAGSVHYSWLNERGIQVHSDRPPPKGVDYEVISTGSTFKRVVSSDEGVVPLETEPRPGNQFDQVDNAQDGQSKKNPETCARAKTNLEALNSSSRVRHQNAKGEGGFLSPEEIDTEKTRARDQIAANCE